MKSRNGTFGITEVYDTLEMDLSLPGKGSKNFSGGKYLEWKLDT